MMLARYDCGVKPVFPTTAFTHGGGTKPALWMSRLARVLKHAWQTGLLAKGARG